jgi:hypothetical protein
LGEDVEDQLASIDDPQLERFFQIALLRRGEIFVDDDQIGAILAQAFLNLVDLATTDQGCRRNVSHLLRELDENRGAGGFREALQLLKAFVESQPMIARREFDPYEDGALPAMSSGDQLFQESRA